MLLPTLRNNRKQNERKNPKGSFTKASKSNYEPAYYPSGCMGRQPLKIRCRQVLQKKDEHSIPYLVKHKLQNAK